MCSCVPNVFHLLELRHSGSYVYTTEPKTPIVCSSLYTKLSSILDLFLAVKKTHLEKKSIYEGFPQYQQILTEHFLYIADWEYFLLFLRLLIKYFLCVRHYSKHLVDNYKQNCPKSQGAYTLLEIYAQTNLSMIVMSVQQNKTSNRLKYSPHSVFKVLKYRSLWKTDA